MSQQQYSANYSSGNVGGAIADASYGGGNAAGGYNASFSSGGGNNGGYNASFSSGGSNNGGHNASFSSNNGGQNVSFSSGGGGEGASFGGSSGGGYNASFSSGGSGGGGAASGELARILPAELQNAQGYGQFETVSSLSSQSASAVDRRLLEHENPNNCNDLAPALSLDQYRLSTDPNPHIIRKKAGEKASYTQEVQVRYLKPPPLQPSGDIVIKQLASKQHAPAPPLIVRQTAQNPQNPGPLVIREAPPTPPQPLPGKVITLPGKTVPPPARKVIVERLAPTPAKPQSVLIERWLPYGEQKQRVIFQQCKAKCQIPDPKNVIIIWEPAEVDVRREVKNLGVIEMNPQQYVSQYGSQLVRADALPEVARQFSQQQGIQLAASGRSETRVVLEGDVQALRLVDLDANGLGHLRASLGAAGASSGSSFSASSSSGGASYGASSGNAGGASFGSTGGANYGNAGGANFGNAGSANFGHSSGGSGGGSYGSASYGGNAGSASFSGGFSGAPSGSFSYGAQY